MDPEELKNKLIEAIFPPLGDPRILIEKAKERVGEKQYHWLIEYAGAGKRTSACLRQLFFNLG
jgi:hypothetical protein